MVYINDLIRPGPNGELHKLLADSLDELHEMAESVGLTRRHFRASPPFVVPHYLLEKRHLRDALSYGAITDKRVADYMKIEDCRRYWRDLTEERILSRRLK